MTAPVQWQALWMAAVISMLGAAGIGMVAEGMPRYDWRAMSWGAAALLLALAGFGVMR